jgi:transposase
MVRLGKGKNASAWLVALLARKPPKLAAVALANKIARIAWRMMSTGEAYDTKRITIASATVPEAA